MRQNLEKETKIRLRNNQSKKAIYEVLATDTNKFELMNLLNSLPSENRRRKTYFITLFILALLLLLTIKQFLFVYLVDNSNVSLILGLIGPIIHIYIMRELLLSHRLAYQALPILSVLALFRPENKLVPDIYMYMCIAVLSGLLYLFLFPKSEKIELPAR